MMSRDQGKSPSELLSRRGKGETEMMITSIILGRKTLLLA